MLSRDGLQARVIDVAVEPRATRLLRADGARTSCAFVTGWAVSALHASVRALIAPRWETFPAASNASTSIRCFVPQLKMPKVALVRFVVAICALSRYRR